MSLPYSTGQQNKSDKKSLEKASEKVTHAFGRTKIFSTSYNSAYFPSVSLSEDTSGCPLYLLSQRQAMKKEACTSLGQTGFGY